MLNTAGLAALTGTQIYDIDVQARGYITHRRVARITTPLTLIEYWADIITGSLYSTKTGRCCSGALEFIGSPTETKKRVPKLAVRQGKIVN